MFLAGVGVDSFSGGAVVVGTASLRALVRGALGFLGLPVIADFLETVLERGVGHPMGTLLAAVFLGGRVMRLAERSLRFAAGPLQRAGQLTLLGLTTLCCFRHAFPSPSGVVIFRRIPAPCRTRAEGSERPPPLRDRPHSDEPARQRKPAR